MITIGAKFLQIGAVIITWDRIITNWGRYYKLLQLLQLQVLQLLQIGAEQHALIQHVQQDKTSFYLQ